MFTNEEIILGSMMKQRLQLAEASYNEYIDDTAMDTERYRFPEYCNIFFGIPVKLASLYWENTFENYS